MATKNAEYITTYRVGDHEIVLSLLPWQFEEINKALACADLRRRKQRNYVEKNRENGRPVRTCKPLLLLDKPIEARREKQGEQ